MNAGIISLDMFISYLSVETKKNLPSISRNITKWENILRKAFILSSINYSKFLFCFKVYR